jgi:eukaryotic-like serine/threonine-protein kinase
VAPSLDQPEEPTLATRCPRCGQTFSAGAGFCPFDGVALVLASDWKKAADPLLGSVVDERYEIEALIGEGGMGSIYRVLQRPLGRAFAMKALRRDLADDSEIRERFLREARTAASVSHPGLVRITDFGYLPDRRPFFVMELLEGLPLRSVLRSGRLTTERAATIARRIAEAMAAAHDAGIVHRDLKPDNVHIAAGDVVKVVDFGLAVAFGGGQRVTRSSIAFGTPHYMSPEQAMGEEVDGRTDVYALGVVLYEMLTGRVPFDAATCAEVLGQQRFAAPTPPSELLGHRSELAAGGRRESPSELGKLERVVLICLAKQAKDRFPSLRHLAAALAAAVPASLALEPAPRDSRR